MISRRKSQNENLLSFAIAWYAPACEIARGKDNSFGVKFATRGRISSWGTEG